jgi:hypothetical protein
MNRKSERFLHFQKSSDLNWSLTARDRESQKEAFTKVWLAEARYRKYRYFVETCSDGKRIYLCRPTRNYGVDFEVRVEGFRSLTRKNKSERPSHDDVIHDLSGKIKARPDLTEELYAVICNTFDCMEAADAIGDHPRVTELAEGLPIDKTLRIIKWLFIEQDLTYWLGTGRNMLMCGIENKVFQLNHHLKH